MFVYFFLFLLFIYILTHTHFACYGFFSIYTLFFFFTTLILWQHLFLFLHFTTLIKTSQILLYFSALQNLCRKNTNLIVSLIVSSFKQNFFFSLLLVSHPILWSLSSSHRGHPWAKIIKFFITLYIYKTLILIPV